MTFKAGKTYLDTGGRKWRIIKVIHHGDYDILLVRRRSKVEVAFTEIGDDKVATVLFNEFNSTMIYDTEGYEADRHERNY